MNSPTEALCEILNELYSVIERLRELDEKRAAELVEKAYKQIDNIVDERLDIKDGEPPEWG